MKIKGYELVNEEKVNRVLNGTLTNNGLMIGGIVKPDGSYDEDLLIARYDKTGGLIKKGIDKVKMGSFYDFKNKKNREIPEVVFVFRINGKIVEVKDGEEESNLVKAAKILEEDKKEKKSKK